jgi:hypothetical protein
VNPAVATPAGTVTLAGTVALVLLLESATAKPPAGATALSVTVQAEDPGAFTVPGEQLKPLTVTDAFTVTVAVLL